MLTVEQLQVRLDLDAGTLHLWIEEGWLLPQRDPDLAFSERDVARAQLILDLKRDMGVNDEGISIILSLVVLSAPREAFSTQYHSARPYIDPSCRGVRLREDWSFTARVPSAQMAPGITLPLPISTDRGKSCCYVVGT